MTTYTTQPDETDGIDTYMTDDATTTNFGTETALVVGAGSGGSVKRTLLKFDFTKGTNTPSATAVVTAGTITLYMDSEVSSNAVTMDFYKCLRNWNESQATWNLYATGGTWSTGGCGNTTTDMENTVLASGSLSATEAAGAKNYALNANGLAVVQGWIQGTVNNYGFLAKTSSEAANTRYNFASSSGTTAANRPMLTLEYTSGFVPQIIIS